MGGWWPWGSAPAAAPAAATAPAPAPVAEAASSDLPEEVPEGNHAPVAVHMPLSTLLVASAFGLGFLSGMASGARRTALVFLAENAHRLPRTVQGWYFYNKTKYYRMILGGAQTGTETGLHMAGWVGGFCLLDVLAEHARNRWEPAERVRDEPREDRPLLAYLGHWSDGTLAGLATALIAGLACTFPCLPSPPPYARASPDAAPRWRGRRDDRRAARRAPYPAAKGQPYNPPYRVATCSVPRHALRPQRRTVFGARRGCGAC